MERTENMTKENKAPNIDEAMAEFGKFVEKATEAFLLNDLEFQLLQKQIRELKADVTALQGNLAYKAKTSTYQGEIYD